MDQRRRDAHHQQVSTIYFLCIFFVAFIDLSFCEKNSQAKVIACIAHGKHFVKFVFQSYSTKEVYYIISIIMSIMSIHVFMYYNYYYQ